MCKIVYTDYFQDSKETIHSGEKNYTLYETQGYFHLKKLKKKLWKKKSKWPPKKNSFSSSANSHFFF